MTDKKETTLQDRVHEQMVELEAMRLKLELSEASFVRNHFPYDASTYSKLKVYAQDSVSKDDEERAYHLSEKLSDKLARCIRNLRDVVANRTRRTLDERPFYATENQRRLIAGIRTCMGRLTQNRLNMFLSPTGGGKSGLIAELNRLFDCTIVEASESWRTSYYACCANVTGQLAAQAGRKAGPWRSKFDVEADMLSALCERTQVLVIEEGNYLGPEAINMIKLILNKTPTVVVMVGLPVIFDRIRSSKKTWVEAEQLLRRANVVVRNTKLSAEDIAPIFKGLNVTKDVLRYVVRHANDFGLYDFVWRVQDKLSEDPKESVTMERAEKVVQLVLDDMGLLEEVA